MKPAVRAWPFESKYLRDFAVVEERHGHLRLFPATEQLPLLSKAIDEEFKAGLTTRLANTDARALAYRKHQLSEVAFAFCSVLNRARPDHLNVQPYFTRDLVAGVAVVQQITAIEPAGNRHWFRFFHGAAFLPDLHLSGKRLIFSGHALDRYRQRTLGMNSHPVNSLFTNLLLRPVVLLQLNGQQTVLAFDTEGTVAVMPFEESAEECFILTTLCPAGGGQLTAFQPPRQVYLHYGPDYTIATDGQYDLDEDCAAMIRTWEARTPPMDPGEFRNLDGHSWTIFVQAILSKEPDTGKEDMKFLFHDGVYGPITVTRNMPPNKPPRRPPKKRFGQPAPTPPAAMKPIVPATKPPALFDLPAGPPKPRPVPDWLRPSPPA